MSLNFMDIFKKEYLKGYFRRNKKIFLAAIIIFLLLGFLSICLEGYSETVSLGEKSLVHAKHSTESAASEGVKEKSMECFVLLTCNNLVQDLTCLFGGLFLFIPSLLISKINAHNFISIFLTWPLPVIVYGVLPHGIFEIPSSIFALAGAIMLFKTEINIIKGIFSGKSSVKEKIGESEYLIKDAIITFFIVVVLLVIAGFIETFITPELITNFAISSL